MLAGLLLGLVGGLIYTWFVVPLKYFDTYPPMLTENYRQDWIRMSTWSYGLDGNWERTQTRLLNLPASEIALISSQVFERAATGGQSPEVLERIAGLASSYGASGPGISLYAGGGNDGALAPPTVEPRPSPTVPLVERTPTAIAATAAPRPRATPRSSATAPATTEPVTIISQTLSCELEPFVAVSLEVSRTVMVRGREVQEQVGLPMREVWLIWDDGADRAITGLRPKKGLGYADFVVVPDRTYNLYIDTPSGRPIITLQVEPCLPTEGTGWVSRILILRETVEVEATPTATVSPTQTLTLSPTPSD